MWFFTILMVVILVFMGIITGLTPFYSRKATPFGVAVTGKHTFVETRKKRYAVWNILLSFLISLPLFIFPFLENIQQAEMWSSFYVLFAIILFMLFSFFLYLKYRKEIQDWRSTLSTEDVQPKQKIVVDTTYHEKLSTRGHFAFFIWQFLIVLVTGAIILSFYDRIPSEIPVQWNADFEVSRSIEKSLWGVLALPGLQLLMIPIFNYSNHAIIKSKQKISPLDPKTASKKSRRFREAWSNFLFFTTIATQLLFSFLALYSMFGQNLPSWSLIATIVIFLVFTLGGTVYLTIKYGQAGEKLLTEEGQYYSDPEEDEKWLLGMIYFNKEDPSIFTEKRFGIGTTLNMGNWKAWIFIGGLILFTVLIILWSVRLT